MSSSSPSSDITTTVPIYSQSISSMISWLKSHSVPASLYSGLEKSELISLVKNKLEEENCNSQSTETDTKTNNKTTDTKLSTNTPRYSYEILSVGPLQCNMTIIFDSQLKQCILSDPGGSPEKILGMLSSNKYSSYKLIMILVTHAHFDHFLAAADVHKVTGAPIALHSLDLPLYFSLRLQCGMIGFPYNGPDPPKPQINLVDGMKIPFGGDCYGHGHSHGQGEIEETGKGQGREREALGSQNQKKSDGEGEGIGIVYHTPGHSPGSVIFYFPVMKLLLSGDTLFRQSVGRTDFTGGNAEDLEKSIRTKIYVLPEDTVVIPGHGEKTTIAYEKKNNMVVRAKY